jgi:hypothetical protein
MCYSLHPFPPPTRDCVYEGKANHAALGLDCVGWQHNLEYRATGHMGCFTICYDGDSCAPSSLECGQE